MKVGIQSIILDDLAGNFINRNQPTLRGLIVSGNILACPTEKDDIVNDRRGYERN